MNLVREIDSGEPLVDIRVVAPKILIARPQVIPYVRERVAEMCRDAAERLPDDRRLSLVEGWRPIERQRRIYEFFWECAREAYPERSYAALRRTVCRWVAPVDQPAPPGHCTGGAVDVWLAHPDGTAIDVSAPYERFQAAPTYSLGLTDNAKRERELLVTTMLGAGFSNCRDEWWHYSWGDAGWAVRTGETACPYGLAHLPSELYDHLEREHAESMRERVNPFLSG